ncbi:MAG: CvpA family protein [Treponema sp.]|jgi:membrane protein required for colicin V production|nr:CvpA family protein [Treponema sp.]
MNSLAPIDIIFIVLILIFVIRCALRGFIEEVLSMAAVVFGFLGAIFFYKNGGVFVREKIPSLEQVQFIPEILAFIILFFIVFLVIKVLEYILKDIIQLVKLSAVDRVLGVLFGLVEGIVLVALVISVLNLVQPIFFKERPVLEGSIFAEKLLPFIHSEAVDNVAALLLKEVQE